MTKKRFLLALALMLTAVGGAWAQGELSESFTVTSGGYSENVSFTGTHFSITGSEGDASGLYLSYATVSVSSLNGENISRVEFHLSTGEAVAQSITTTAGTNSCTNGNANGSITGINATSLTLSTQLNGYVAVEIDQITVYYAPPAGTLVEDGNNQWHLAVPAGNVTLTVDYYGQYTLDSVPTAEGWQVMVNGSPATVSPYTPGSALGHVDNINETDSVELIPPAELRGTIKAVRLTESVAAPAEPITVTINQSDWGNASSSFTKDGVTVSAGSIDATEGDLYTGGSFSTTLGNFTSIVVTSFYCNASGTGWSDCSWSGTPASSVSFSGDFMGMGEGQTTIVCTIQPNN